MNSADSYKQCSLLISLFLYLIQFRAPQDKLNFIVSSTNGLFSLNQSTYTSISEGKTFYD